LTFVPFYCIFIHLFSFMAASVSINSVQSVQLFWRTCVCQLRGGGSGRRRTEAERSEACRRVTQACLSASASKQQRPVCASDGLTYASKCDVRRARRCERRRITVVSAGHCPTGHTTLSLLYRRVVFTARRYADAGISCHMANQCTKIEVSSFSRSRDILGD